ncbi:DUF4870 domain-containing protein [Marinilabilia rubra]|uniref:DUF4870 domain-containing protein n=1 Tax=Marinilabilia rubra TaxID=2162893 RepID=A0A2U2BE30_9BACT|nr:DUF4870 domain-containing protein [Marinilabilia rubra]PWE01325.1 DUF4870 domain-containing protein [Marinilabilia rubra]
MTPDEKNWGMYSHLAAFAGLLFPFGNVIGPLIIWVLKKDEYPFVEQEGKESLNFQITVSIAVIVAGLLSVVLIGIPLLIAIAIFALVFIIKAAMETSEGRPYRYPYNLRLIK